MENIQIDGIVEHSDNFLSMTKHGVYRCRCSGFILRNAGNTLVTLEEAWELLPGQEYNFQSMNWEAIVNKDYNVKFGSVNITGSGEEPKPKVMIAEEHYHTRKQTNYSPLK